MHYSYKTKHYNTNILYVLRDKEIRDSPRMTR